MTREPAAGKAVWELVEEDGGDGSDGGDEDDGDNGDGGDDEEPEQPPAEPVASFSSSDATVEEGATVEFDASASEGPIEVYEWTFGDGTTATGPVVSHAYETADSHTVTLTVRDDEERTDTATTTITVLPAESPGETPPSAFPENVFAPYNHASTKPGTSLAGRSTQAGTDYMHLAFVLAGPDGEPAWDGDANQIVGETRLDDEIRALQEQGGDVVVAFGGAVGPYLADGADDPDVLADRFETVVDQYDVTHLDIDEEAFARGTIKRRNEALAILQQRRPEVSVSFTLPVTTRGLTAGGRFVLENALEHGVTIENVNIMTMNFGWVRPSADVAIDAATSTHGQLQELFPDESETELWNRIGITPMIGVNNVGGAFRQEDAEELLSFAQEQDLALLSFWSIDRDNGVGSGEVSPTRSGIDQEDFEFSGIFAEFTSEYTDGHRS